MTILDKIFAHKREEVALSKQSIPLETVQAAAAQTAPALDFCEALQAAPVKPALIAEVKKASPSRGLLAPDFDPIQLARTYQQNGASAVSVLTDERFFQGSPAFLQQIAALDPRLPLLRKDFIFDPYQVYEARAIGADAVLLIAAMLPIDQLLKLHTLALELGLTPLVEVHTLDELKDALLCSPVLVGINNRDLHDFSVNLDTSLRIRPHIPDGVTVVGESGIHTPQDTALLAEAGIDAVLVGEALVTAPDTALAVRQLSGQPTGFQHSRDRFGQ